jgi:hypothetical protein
MTATAKVLFPPATCLGFTPAWQWSDLMPHLIAIAVAGFLLWLAVNRLEWFRLSRRQYSQTQEALFAELCQAHALSRSDRTLLSLIAQTLGVHRPCGVFVDPRVIQQFAQNNPADAEGCADLVRRLFGAHVG